MKFWQKAFLLTLLLFVLAFYTGIFFLANYSYKSTLQNYRERSFGEHYFIASSFSSDFSAILNRNDDYQPALESLFTSYENYYKNRNVSLALLDKGKQLLGDLPPSVTESPALHNPPRENPALQSPSRERRSVIETVDDKKFLLVSGSLGENLQDYTLIYAYDLSEVMESQTKLTQFLIGVSFIIISLMALFLFLVFKKLTRPINELQKATARITLGEYNHRAPVYGQDEIAQLAQSFNAMAQEIEHKIQELHLSSEQKQQFIDNFAHELRTPLTTIKGYAQYLQQIDLKEDERIEALNFILSAVNRIQNMANKLLDLALTRSGAISIQEIQISTLFAKVKETINLKLSQKNLNIITENHLERIWGDPFLLESLLCNLVDNAINASPTGSTIWLRALDENYGVIEVKDQGKGMSPEEIQHITQPFYRVDKARSRETGGTGIGLALCHQIAQRHKALLEIFSQPDQGTRIRLRFTTSLQPEDKTMTSGNYD
ncbi:MAG: HAMP domain-containing histidine kinase [Peptococcaceae bacterium]|jgi:two-component system OmpR family sensor kinase|nr:HAMP domain-containing histidine kinase [Peptococcaceae bacterium]